MRKSTVKGILVCLISIKRQGIRKKEKFYENAKKWRNYAHSACDNNNCVIDFGGSEFEFDCWRARDFAESGISCEQK